MPLKQSCKEDFWVQVKFKTTNHNQPRLDIYLTSIYYTNSIYYTFTTTFTSFSNVNQIQQKRQFTTKAKPYQCKPNQQLSPTSIALSLTCMAFQTRRDTTNQLITNEIHKQYIR